MSLFADDICHTGPEDDLGLEGESCLNAVDCGA